MFSTVDQRCTCIFLKTRPEEIKHTAEGKSLVFLIPRSTEESEWYFSEIKETLVG